jgi:hypothetical protein
MGWLILFLMLGLLGWITQSWVITHGLAVLTPSGHWEMMGEGWHGVGYILIIGLIIGLVGGVFAGSGFADLIKSWITSNDDAAREKLLEERQQIELVKTQMDDRIKKAFMDGRKVGAAMAEKASLARFEAEDKARRQDERNQALEGRLKGSQQKAARLKKTLLTRGDAPKPETV